MSKFCHHCGNPLSENSLFCPECGIRLEPIQTTEKEIEVEKKDESLNLSPIDPEIKLGNSQYSIVKKSILAMFLGLILTFFPFTDGHFLTGVWALALVGVFVFFGAFVVAIIFRSRAKKLQSLITGENVISSWTLNPTEKSAYVNYLFEHERAKNKGIFWITTILIVVIFGIFILVIPEGKVAMFFVMLLLIAAIGAFAFGMPHYYKSKNTSGDGHVLIGIKFAYINGFFHNWDFPLSGINKAKVIHEPFYGVYIKYYYTDRTFTNTEELNIPAPKNIDLQKVINELNIN